VKGDALKIDVKGVGYLISAISVFFLGIVAWPTPEDPKWHAWAVAIGMATSIAGMGTRYISHRRDRKDIERAARDQPPSSG
jgi:hypothetical protein